MSRRSRKPAAPGASVTLKDVAERAGVSVATVSHAINRTRKVKDDTRDSVFAAITELGYSGHSIARSLRRGRTAMLGLVVSDIENPFFTMLASRVQRAAAAHGYQLIFANSEERADREREIAEAMSAQRVDGIILAPVAERQRRAAVATRHPADAGQPALPRTSPRPTWSPTISPVRALPSTICGSSAIAPSRSSTATSIRARPSRASPASATRTGGARGRSTRRSPSMPDARVMPVRPISSPCSRASRGRARSWRSATGRCWPRSGACTGACCAVPMTSRWSATASRAPTGSGVVDHDGRAAGQRNRRQRRAAPVRSDRKRRQRHVRGAAPAADGRTVLGTCRSSRPAGALKLGGEGTPILQTTQTDCTQQRDDIPYAGGKRSPFVIYLVVFRRRQSSADSGTATSTGKSSAVFMRLSSG